MQRRRFSMGIMSRAVFILVLFCCSSLLVNGGFHRKARYKFSGPIKTVVVLVMENRSFDHMLGWLKRLNPEIDGVTGEECNPLNTLDDESPSVCFSDNAEFVDPDPGHSFPEIREQVFGSNDTSAVPPPMNGFAQQAESMAEGLSKTVMNGFRPELVPAYTALAMEFAVLDKWFSSTPTSTQPNRLFVQSATSHGLISNVRNALIKGFPQKTIFDSVHEAGLSFGIYYQNIPAVLFFKNLRRLKYITKFHDYKLAFKLHAKLGKLPNYAVIEQRYFDVSLTPANDDHPSHDISQGQNLVKEIYEALRSSPQWNETLFVITYDEHGGFYDHVPTPNSHVPNPDGIVADDFDFKRLGVRVPTIMVSPWINKGTVMHGPDGPTPFSQFEHSSIPATVKKLFGLEKFLTKRDAWAGTFENIIGARTTPRTDCPVELPNSPWSLRHSRMNEHAKISEFQQELVMLAAHLNGDHALMNNLYLGKTMTVRQANDYVEDAVASFLNTGLSTLKAGANESNVLQLTRSAGNRKEGPANFLLSQD